MAAQEEISMTRFAIFVAALMLAVSQHAAAQSGCRQGFINPLASSRRGHRGGEAGAGRSRQERVPDFEASAFADNTIEDLLRMTSGVALKTSYARGEVSDN